MATTVTRSTTVRISRQTHDRLRSIARETGEQLSDVLERAVQHEERRLFWQRFHEDVARLKQDKEGWQAYLNESKELEGTLMDGLDPDEDWSFLASAKPGEIEFLALDGEAGAEPR